MVDVEAVVVLHGWGENVGFLREEVRGVINRWFSYLLPGGGIGRGEKYKSVAGVPCVVLFFEPQEGRAVSVKGGVSICVAVGTVELGRVGELAGFGAVML